jgi:hypothetical protein
MKGLDFKEPPIIRGALRFYTTMTGRESNFDALSLRGRFWISQSEPESPKRGMQSTLCPGLILNAHPKRGMCSPPDQWNTNPLEICTKFKQTAPNLSVC